MQHIAIHLFDLQSPSNADVFQLLAKISATPKSKRFRHIGFNEIGLQQIQFVDKNIALMDFVKLRRVGPGKVRASGDVSAFDFEVGESYGEETAALYDKSRGWLVVQYNHHGPRATAAAEYLNVFDTKAPGDFIVQAMIDQSVESQLRRRGVMRSFEFRIKTTKAITQQLRGSGQGLAKALAQYADQSRSGYIDMQVGMSERKGGMSESYQDFFRILRSLGGSSELTKLKVTARENVDSKDLVLDLLEQHITQAIATRELDIIANRYTLESRWKALRRVHADWLKGA